MSNERERLYYAYDLDLTDNERKMLREYGLEKIVDDEEELINYAIVIMLKETIKKAEAGELNINELIGDNNETKS